MPSGNSDGLEQDQQTEIPVVWVFVGVAAGIFAVVLFAELSYVRVVLPLFENPPPINVAPASPDSNAEPIEFSTSDGLVLRGSLLRSSSVVSKGLIVFCHEFSSNHWSATHYCEGLLDQGFDILAFDFRNHGESDRMPNYEPLHWITEYEVEDVEASLQYIRNRPDLCHQPIGLFGISRGGNAAIVAAARNEDINEVACEGAFSTDIMLDVYARRWMSIYVHPWISPFVPKWHVRVTLAGARWVSQFRRGCRYVKMESYLPQLSEKSVLLISGERDSYVLPEVTRHINGKIGSDSQRIWTVPHAKHSLARPACMKEYDRRLACFFLQESPTESNSEVAETITASSMEPTS